MITQIPSRQSFDWRPSIGRMAGLSQVDVERMASRRHPLRGSREWAPGLGQSSGQLASEAASYAGTAASTTASILALTGTISATAGALTGGIAAVAVVLTELLIKIFSGCGQTCTLTSDEANQIGAALTQNLVAYFQSGHTQAEQAAALANFDNTWAQLVQYCGNPSFGSAGQNCISDRQQGACHYKTSPGGWQQTNDVPTPASGQGAPVVIPASQCNGQQWVYVYPGAEGSGSTCWNWYVGLRDPIANDPCVIANSASPSTAASVTGTGTVSDDINSIWSELTGGGADYGPLLVIGGILLAALLL
jgi:hypothetical protein